MLNSLCQNSYGAEEEFEGSSRNPGQGDPPPGFFKQNKWTAMSETVIFYNTDLYLISRRFVISDEAETALSKRIVFHRY